MLIDSPEMMMDIIGEDLVLFLHTKHPVSDSSFSGFVSFFKSRIKLVKNSKLKCLAISDGGGPMAQQRKELSKLLEKASVRSAVVSDSFLIPFIVSAIALFNPRVRSFGPAKINDALDFLECTKVQKATLLQTLQQHAHRKQFTTLQAVLNSRHYDSSSNL